jgi:hypothetical protein
MHILAVATDLARHVLARGPLWHTLLFDRPWAGALLALVAGVAIAALARRAGQPRASLAALVVGVIAAVGVLVVSSTFTTTRTMLRAQTLRFVDAIAGADADTVGELVGPRFVIASSGVPGLNLGREWLVGVTRGMDAAIASNTASIEDIQLEANVATVTFSCRTKVTQHPQTIGSRWQVQWQRYEADAGAPGGNAADAWKIIRLEAISIYGREPGQQWVQWATRYRGRSAASE